MNADAVVADSPHPVAGPVLLDEEWELDLTIADAPVVLAEACGTEDGCAPSCASACASR